MKKYILSNQLSLFGHNDVIGFGTSDWCVKEIDRDLAYEVIIKNHYSHKGDSLPHNKVNLGCFIKNNMVGVLQFGYAMNAMSCDKIVKNTDLNEYYELNRMWMSDKAPKNTESRAISYSIKYIKRKHPKIKWIQSFADERCGKLGIVYQACNFGFYGSHSSIFWEIDGETYHNSILTNGTRAAKKRLEPKLKYAKKMIFNQYRYLYFIKKKHKVDCLLKELPYPKHYKEIGQKEK